MTMDVGKTTIGALMEVGGDYVRGTEIIPGVTGKALSITAYIQVAGCLNASIRCMIHDSGFNLIGATELIDAPATVGIWKTFCFADNPNVGTDPDSQYPDGHETNGPWLISGNHYWITVWCAQGTPFPGVVRLFYDGGAMNESLQETLPFVSSWVPNPLIPDAYHARRYSIYATLATLQNASEDLHVDFTVEGNGEEDLKVTFSVPGYAFIELKAKLYVKLYRGPENIEANTWGAILIIDPNRQRVEEPIGPLYFLLDSMTVKPGLTDRAGAFHGEINDNGCTDPESKVAPQFVYDKHLPYWIFGSAGWIRDDDEFWIGVQRGPGNDPWDPEPTALAWNPVGGDGKGSGRMWLMGGYLNNRHYEVDRTRRITAVIEGRCHMDIWKDQLFGTPSIPRNYTMATDLATIAADLISDIVQAVGFEVITATITILDYSKCAGVPVILNVDGAVTTLVEGVDWNRGASNNAAATSLAAAIDALSGVSANVSATATNMVEITEQTFLKALGAWPGFLVGPPAPTSPIQVSAISHTYRPHPTWFSGATGTTWMKEFKQEAANDVMMDICSEVSYEWRINHKMQVMFYIRGQVDPGLTSPAIDFENIRDIPEIVMGDTTERITHVISTDATAVTVPKDVGLWCLFGGYWPDRYAPNRTYINAFPYPPNPLTGSYCDPSLVMDPDGQSAICFMKDSAGSFIIDLCLSHDSASGNYSYSSLHLDLRIWRKLKFKFRHVTRVSAAGNSYLIAIWTSYNGLGSQNFYWRHFTSSITNSEWVDIEFDLPELYENGSVKDLKGWTPHDDGGLDPTNINFIHFLIACGETPVAPPAPSGPYLYQQITLATNYDPATDKDSCEILNPERLAGYAVPMTNPVEYFPLSHQHVTIGGEEAEIMGVHIPNLPVAGNNVQLKRVLNGSHVAGTGVRLRMGWAMCLSQVHFERNLRVEKSGSGIHPPYRFRMMVSKEMDSLGEATARADATLNEEAPPRQYNRFRIDGDPRFTIGHRARVDLPMDPFVNVYMILDDIEYRLDAEVDFQIETTVGLVGRKARQLNELSIIEAHERRLENISLGKTELP